MFNYLNRVHLTSHGEIDCFNEKGKDDVERSFR